MPRPKKRKPSARRERDKTTLARLAVLKEARKRGYITNDMACEVGGFAQAWYHLNALAKAGLLKHDAYNNWRPVSR